MTEGAGGYYKEVVMKVLWKDGLLRECALNEGKYIQILGETKF